MMSNNSNDRKHDIAVTKLKNATFKYYHDLVDDFREHFYRFYQMNSVSPRIWQGHALSEEALASLGMEMNQAQHAGRIDKLPKIDSNSRGDKWEDHAAQKFYKIQGANSRDIVYGRFMIDLIMETLQSSDDIENVRKLFACADGENYEEKPIQLLYEQSPEAMLLLQKLDAASKLLSIVSAKGSTSQNKVKAFSQELHSKETQEILLKKRSRAGDIFLGVVLTVLAPIGLVVGAYRLWGKVKHGKDFVISMSSSGADLSSSAENIIKKAQEDKKRAPLSFFKKEPSSPVNRKDTRVTGFEIKDSKNNKK